MFLTLYILFLVMNNFVFHLAAKSIIGVVFICHEFRFSDIHNTSNEFQYITTGSSFCDFSNNLTTAFYSTDNSRFAGASSAGCGFTIQQLGLK